MKELNQNRVKVVYLESLVLSFHFKMAASTLATRKLLLSCATNTSLFVADEVLLSFNTDIPAHSGNRFVMMSGFNSSSLAFSAEDCILEI